MSEKSTGKASRRAMAAALRRRTPQEAADEAVPVLAMPEKPSAEYVARANEFMGRTGAGPEFIAARAEREREYGGMYGTLPLAKKAAARLPVNPYPQPPQGPPVGAEQVARWKAEGRVSPDDARQRMKGMGAVDPRLLAQLLRGAR